MSFGSQFDEPDLQLHEHEYARLRQQQLASHPAFSALAARHPGEYGALGMLQSADAVSAAAAASSYYARQAAASQPGAHAAAAAAHHSFGRPPYTTVDRRTAAAYGISSAESQQSQAAVARLYEQQRHHPHAAAAHGIPPGAYAYPHLPHPPPPDPRYGAPPPPPPHGAYPPPGYGHDPATLRAQAYAQHEAAAAAAASQHHAAAAAAAAATPTPAAAAPAPASNSATSSGSPTGGPPSYMEGSTPSAPAPAAAKNLPPAAAVGSSYPPTSTPKSPPHQNSAAASAASTNGKGPIPIAATPSKDPVTPGSPGVSPLPPPSPKMGMSSSPAVVTGSAVVSSMTGLTSKKMAPQHRQVENTIVDENGEHQWFTGCVPLGLADDKYWLSELQVFLRSNFAEAFGATEDDIAAPMHGRNKPIVLGQVGIRCMHCKHDNPAERGQQATSYPSQISGIYNSVQQMLRLHLDCCLSMPGPVKSKIEQLRLSCSSRGGRKQYWIDSAKRLGLVDTPHGIHFGRDPEGPLPPLTGPSVNYKENKKKKLALKAAAEQRREEKNAEREKKALAAASSAPLERPTQPPVDSRPLVYPEDKPLISDYLYLTLEQMAPCNLMEADRVGCYKTRSVGFPGLACKHCVGQAGCGRYFPASEASLSQTTTSQTIMNHVRNCRRCPIEIRENLEIMKRNRMGPDGKRADKPKHGGRKVFFHRLWCRIQGIPFEEGKGERKEPKKKKLYKKPGPAPKKGKKKRRRKGESSEESNSESDTDTEEEEEEAESDVSEEAAKPRSRKSQSNISKRKAMSPWYEGCVRLTKSDDPHWLSEMECFARSDLVEVFSLKKNDTLDGYSSRREPAVGQVGIRCVFCKNVDPSERSNGCVSFPDMLSSIHTKVADMVRLHFTNCPSMPEDMRKTFKSLRGYDAKVANDDSQQYWVDSARDIGLANIPPEGIGSPGSWGVTFRRDPLQPSPADELDLESGQDAWGKNLMVRPADRGLCTDHVLLMLCQVRPCRFRKSDRRAGPGSRGRDRAMGFPGLACLHCANKNSLGRYFPVSAKNLTDNTANSLQAHISSCSRCPEHIQASLAYLSHRSILQKAELSGSWKKAFFKKVWDRLHNERDWTALEEDVGDASDDYDSAEEQEEAGEFDDENEEDDDDEQEEEEQEEEEEEEETEVKEEEAENEEDSEKEEVGDQMNALIKAAAIWLTEQDQTHEPPKSARSQKSRSLPGKRSASRGSSSLPTKRRRGQS